MPDLVPMRCRTTCGRAKATASNVTHQRTAESLCHPYRPTMRWRGTDLFCSRWFGNGLGLDCGKLMGLDRRSALNILAGNPTTQMPCGLAASFLENRLPFTTFGDRRSARQPIWRAMPARLRRLRLGVARTRRSDGTFGALGLDIVLQIVNCNSVFHDPSGISKAWRK